MLNPKLKEQLIKRIKSLLWRALMFLIIGILDILITFLSDFNLPNGITFTIGLILGEISKYINTYNKTLK